MKLDCPAPAWQQDIADIGYKHRRNGRCFALATARQKRRAEAKQLKKQAKLAARKRNKGEVQA